MNVARRESSRHAGYQWRTGSADERPAEHRAVRLGDGRVLGYAEFGAPNGRPIFVFHGSPGARLQVRVAHGPALARGIRIVAPDRPGQGLSTRQPGREIADWPEDVRALADALGITRFAVVGISGGGPYAAACAWALPGRVSRAGIISGVVPGAGPDLAAGLRRHAHGLLELVLDRPWLMRAIMALGAVPCRRLAGQIFELASALAPPEDHAMLRRPDIATALIASLREAFRGGSQGVADDLLLLTRPWTVRPQEVQVPVRLWHGEDDDMVPVAMGRRLAEVIPHCRAEFIPGGGHYVVFDRIGPILDAMTA